MSKIKVSKCGNIEGLYIIEPTYFYDERGFFVENYNKEKFFENGLTMNFVQDNMSKSKKGVLRGLHFQKEYPQGKLLRVVSGEIYDVAVDIREGSPTYGKCHGLILSEENHRQFYISEGFAHGFLVLSDEALVEYKCTDYYHPGDEGGILWSDETLGIDWPLNGITPIISEKDNRWCRLTDIKR